LKGSKTPGSMSSYLLDGQESGKDSKRGLVREGMNLCLWVEVTGDQETQQKV